MHQQARDYVAAVVAGEQFRSVVEVGGRNINGTVRDLITCDQYTAVDLHDGDGVDVVADCRKWVPPDLVDLVVCCEVLEHAEDPKGIVAACISYLAPGGRLVLTCAGPDRAAHSAIDGGELRDGEHYANVKPAALRKWLARLRRVDVQHRTDVGDVYATGTR